MLNNLPFELYETILEYLDLNELLNVRLLNRRFKLVVSEFRIKELIFRDLKKRLCVQHKDNWFHLNKPQNCHAIIDISRIKLLSSSIFKIQNLKRLFISELGINGTINLDNVNEFKQLEHLEFSFYLNKINIDKNRKLSLSNLKSFSFSFIRISDDLKNEDINSIIEFDTPSLEAIRLSKGSDLVYFKFNNPSTIKYLSLTFYDEDTKIFKNVEYLCVLVEITISSNFLSKYPNLKEIRIHEFRDDKNSLIDNMQKKDLKIYFKDVQILNAEDLNDCEYELDFQMANYARLDYNLQYDSILNYSNLMNLTNKIPVDFFKKFTNINAISIDNRVENEDNLIEFIKNCQNLFDLCLKNSELSQNFYDQLASISSLGKLIINEKEDLNINFEFINKMYYLFEFKTNQQLDLKENYALNYLIYLKFIEFQISKNQIKVIKSKRDEYKLKISRYSTNKLEFPIETMTLKKLINWYTQLKYLGRTRSGFKKMKTQTKYKDVLKDKKEIL